MNSSKECIFCKIVSREISTTITYEDDAIIAFSDLNPQAPTHILVIPKQHFASILELHDSKISTKLFEAIRKIMQEKDIENFRTVINTGEQAGQTVFHLHIHLLAGRNFSWPPG
jgi:histidine triad (HIT) family protein